MTGFFEDIAIGDVETFGTHTFTAGEIKTFARAFDPQPFHLDDDAAAQSHFGALCASGWHTAALWMKLRVGYYRAQAEAAAAAGVPFPKLGPSPGFKDLRWLRPVYAGDTLTYSATVTGKRPSASRPQWGLVMQHSTAVNQSGDRVFEFAGAAFWERRTAG